MTSGSPSERVFFHKALLLALACAGAAASALATQPVQSGQAEDAGVVARWRYESQASDSGSGLGRLTVELSDATGQSPLRYRSGQLAAWLQRHRPVLSENELACRDKAKRLASQGVGQRADIDLNTHRLITLNRDATVAFINPFVGLNNAKLESIVVLPGPPSDWLAVPERLEIWVRSGSRLVAIDTHSRRITRSVNLPLSESQAAQLGPLVYQAGAERLWLALPGGGLPHAADAARLASLKLSDPGSHLQFHDAPGLRRLQALALPDGVALFSSHADGRVLQWRLSAQGLPQVQGQWAGPGVVRDWAYSSLADAVLVISDSGQAAVLPLDGAAPHALTLRHAVQRMALLDRGRLALLVGDSRLSVVDLANGQALAEGEAPARTQELLFTTGYAYAVSPALGQAMLWSLRDLRAARLQPVRVNLGSPMPAGPAIYEASGLVRSAASPAGTGMLFANASDAMVYQYAEGMMAPVGSFSNYRREPMALQVLDLSPREVAPGRYEALVRHPQGGAFELVLSGVAPRFAACALLALATPPGDGAATTEPTPRARVARLYVPDARGQRIDVRLARVADAGQAGDVALVGTKDLQLLLIDPRAGWQRRWHLRETPDGSGLYSAHVQVPRPGSYGVFVSSASLQMGVLQGDAGEHDLGGSARVETSEESDRAVQAASVPAMRVSP